MSEFGSWRGIRKRRLSEVKMGQGNGEEERRRGKEGEGKQGGGGGGGEERRRNECQRLTDGEIILNRFSNQNSKLKMI